MGNITAEQRGLGSTKACATKVTVGDETVAFKRNGQSSAVIAKILGRRQVGNLESIWLDRLVHDDDEHFVDWSATGAISTVLTRDVQAPEAH